MSKEIKKSLFDKNGYEILSGDLLKIFHFVGKNRKKYYMYKWVEQIVELGKNKLKFFKILHLNLKNEFYYLPLNGKQVKYIEIIQGYGENSLPFDDRKKYKFEK